MLLCAKRIAVLEWGIALMEEEKRKLSDRRSLERETPGRRVDDSTYWNQRREKPHYLRLVALILILIAITIYLLN